MEKFELKYDEARDLFTVSWLNKRPKIESALHKLGGEWDDFNRYRFPARLDIVKTLNAEVKKIGKLTMSDLETKQHVQRMVLKDHEVKDLTSGDSDAELSEYLVEQYPETAKALRPYQRAAAKFMSINRYTLLADHPGTGKAQPLSEPVLTPDGWKTMGDIKPGDQVVGPNGKPVDVLNVFPQGKKEIAKVTFSDGTVVRCDWDHLWHTQNKYEKEITGKHKVLTTREMFEQGVADQSGRSRFSIPMTEPVEFSEKSFPIDPYTWGAITGDGSVSETNQSCITSDHEIVESLVLPEGVSAKIFNDKGWWGEYRLNGLSRILREHGLNGTRSEEKFIPDEIRFGSIEQRVSYLQGLLDSDGGTAPGRDGKLSSSIEYGTVSERLACQVADLVQSLGGNATVRTKETSYTHLGEKREGQLFYRMNIRLPEGIKPFRLKRKAERWIPRAKYQPQRWIRSIESTGEKEEMQCILVDSNDHLYLTTGYAVTHNTLSTIAALVGDPSVEGDILILSPSIATQVSWPTELKKWAPDDEVVRVVGSRAKREEALQALRVKPKGKRRWILCNVDMAKVKYHKETVSEGQRSKSWYQCVYPELFYYDFNQAKPKNDREWGVIVLDEAHKVLVTDKSQAYKQTQIRCGLGRLKVKENGKRFALTGTPFRGKLENLWGTLNWLDPKKYSSYHKWISQWFPTEDGFFGGKEIKEIQPEKKKPFFDAIAPFTLRRTKGEIAKDLPPKVYVGDVPEGVSYDPGEEAGLVGHWLDMGPKQKRAYNEMVEHAMASLESGNLVANGVLAELTRLKQFAGTYGEIIQKEDSDGFLVDHFRPALPSNKFDWLLQFLEELGIVKGSLAQGPDDNKVVVASQFTSVLNLFEKELKKKGIEVYKITGGVSMKKREEAAHVFQTDTGPQVMLLNTYAGGVALTLDRADDIVILDETFIPDDQEQVEDRVHRVSRNHNVFIHYVRSLGTIEERIARTTFGRDTVQKEILDGERGIDFARKLL